MLSPTLRPSFSTVVSALGGWLTVLRRPTPQPLGPAPYIELGIIRPSRHARVAIEAHRDDRV